MASLASSARESGKPRSNLGAWESADRFGCRRSVRRNRSLCFTIFLFPGGSQVIHRLFQRFGGRAKPGDLRIQHGQDNQPASGVRMGFEHGFSAGDCFVIPLSNLKPDRSPLFRRGVRWPFGCGEQMAVELPPGKRPGLAEPNRCAEAVFGNRPSDKNTKSPIETEFVARMTSRFSAKTSPGVEARDVVERAISAAAANTAAARGR